MLKIYEKLCLSWHNVGNGRASRGRMQYYVAFLVSISYVDLKTDFRLCVYLVLWDGIVITLTYLMKYWASLDKSMIHSNTLEIVLDTSNDGW